MIQVNENYSKLQASYLFVDIARKVSDFQEKNPDKEIIKLGIGDVTSPLPEEVLKEFHAAVDEMAKTDTFKGYGPEQGYQFLRDLIAENEYNKYGVKVASSDIFISDGSKCDTGNIQEIFSTDIKVAVPDPVYPVYVDTNVMAGRAGTWKDGRYDGLVYLNSNKDNNFVPELPKEKVDLIYLCFPNNPTGATATKTELKKWVDYALKNNALILFDAAYVSFIRDPELPKSIFEIKGAEKVAIEFRSFSKNAGFTGTRCAFTVIPEACRAFDKDGKEVSVRALWNRRHSTKFNGVSYPVQKAAAAVYSKKGQEQVQKLTDYYLENARIIKTTMEELGFWCTGGDNSPYIWIDGKTESWEFFDLLLNRAGIVCTPGSGFGTCGEGYIRISAFNSVENVQKAMARIKEMLEV